MIKHFIIILIGIIPYTSFSQESTFIASDSIVGEFSDFSIDNFGRVYLCQNDVILQYYADQDTFYSTSLKTLRPTTIESSKSFRSLVFDQERSLIRFFDNTLTDINGQIDLVNIGIQQPVLVCESFSGNAFWALDGGLMRLVKIDQDLKIISQTENLVRLFDHDQLPSQMFEHNDFLYVLIPGKGVAIFDIFGTFIRIVPTQAETIGVLNDYLLLKKGNVIEAVANDAAFSSDFRYTIPDGVNQFFFTNGKVYFLTEDKLLIGAFQKEE